MRVSFEEIYMNLARDLARRSTCRRLNVGAVVASEDYSRVYGIGYNGNAAGLDNDCDSDTPGQCGCLHAEDNALLKTNGGREILKRMFVTHAPCVYCAKRIVNKGGIVAVYFNETYRCTKGLEVLEKSGIKVIHLPS